MEEKEEKSPKRCVNCEYHEQYYSKCASRFYRHKTGYCSRQQKVTENQDTCEEWKRKNGRPRRGVHKNAAAKAVAKMADNILVIAQILCDDQREEQEENKL